ncbi:MAG TPA: EfeM/EfeO family lipoprotein [Solirubrobacteraceae bacterium]|nr:EfeM/EfeO family lipoprotein [Solirubrobacteraceae bacterium]
MWARSRPGLYAFALAALIGFLAFAVRSGPFASRASAATLRPCSTYPVPGTVAPPGSLIPGSILRRYGLFRRGQQANDELSLGALPETLPASGIVTSGIRFLGRAGDRGRLYAIPAEHFLPRRMAPLRCLPVGQRQIERDLLPLLRRDYAQPAVCVAELGGDSRAAAPVENCAPLAGAPDAMLATRRTPLVGLAPDGVTAVTARFLTAPARTVKVRDNFYEIAARSPTSSPCGVEWLDASGNVARSIAGCDYLPAELGPLITYRTRYVLKELATVRLDLTALSGAISAGDLAEAQSDWLTAHLAWLDIGQDDGAYGCFGELGGEIDGTAAGLVGGTASAQFTGFHKVELDLWTDGNLTAAAADTTTLQQLVKAVIATPIETFLPATQAGIANWVLRPHEILEDAMRDTLTGDDDYGSGTGLASITADVSAVSELLGLLAPVLDPLAPHLVARAGGQLNAILAAVDQTQVNGTWVAVGDLPTVARERVDAAVGAALETLAPIPDLLTSTGNVAPLT